MFLSSSLSHIIAARRVERLEDVLVFARGTSGWEKRYVVIEGETLSIYKNKKSVTTKPKYIRTLTPGNVLIQHEHTKKRKGKQATGNI